MNDLTANAALPDQPAATFRESMSMEFCPSPGGSCPDCDMAGDAAAHGIPVGGLNALQYFWRWRIPDGAPAWAVTTVWISTDSSSKPN